MTPNNLTHRYPPPPQKKQFPLDFLHNFLVILPSEKRALDNSNLLLNWSKKKRFLIIYIPFNQILSLQQFILCPVSDWYIITGWDVQVRLSCCHLLFKTVKACNAKHKVWAMGHYLQITNNTIMCILKRLIFLSINQSSWYFQLLATLTLPWAHSCLFIHIFLFLLIFRVYRNITVCYNYFIYFFTS